MRSDMGRVVIERPRRGSANKSPKVRHLSGQINADGDYDGATRLPSSAAKMHAFAPKTLEKEFTDVLGPLRRYLRKNVGRPWDKVYGEGKKVLQSGGWGVQHVFDAHFLGAVDRAVYVDQAGKLRSWSWRYCPEVEGFYVHPRTGLLRYAPPEPRHKPKQPRTDLIERTDGRYYVLIRGLWYIARYEEIEQPDGKRARRRVVEKSCNKKDLREIRRVLEE